MKKKLSKEQLRKNRDRQREYRRNNKERTNATARKSYHKRKANFTEEYIAERNLKNTEWAKQNHEKIQEHRQRYHNKNKAKRNAQCREWYQENKEHRYEYNKAYNKANPEKPVEHRRNYVARNPEKAALEKMRAKEKKYGCKKTHCIFCGYDHVEALNWHHLIPKKKGGTDDHYNIIVVCANCHRKIHNPDSDCIGTCKRCDTEEAFIEVHHINPKHKGGTDDPENLVEICACCHRMAHAELRTGSDDMVLEDPQSEYPEPHDSGVN